MKKFFKNHTAIVLLRWGIAFVFFYAAVSALVHSQDWIGYFPEGVRKVLGVHQYALLSVFSVYEIFLAGWLFLGRNLKIAAGLSFLSLAGITIANIQILDVVFRDVGLALAALALYVLAAEKERNKVLAL